MIVPNDLLGRINSAYWFFGWGTMPLGALQGGQLAAATSLRMPFIPDGIGMLLAVSITLAHLLRTPPTADAANASAKVAAPPQHPNHHQHTTLSLIHI